MKHDIAADAWAVHCVAHDIYVLAESGKRSAAKRLYEKYEGAFVGLELGMREVPVVKQSEMIPFPGRVCTCSVRADRGEALPKRQSHFDDCAVFGREVPVKKARRQK